MAEKIVVSVDDGVNSGEQKLENGEILKWYIVKPEPQEETREEKQNRLRAKLLETQQKFKGQKFKYEDPFGPAVPISDFEVYEQ